MVWLTSVLLYIAYNPEDIVKKYRNEARVPRPSTPVDMPYIFEIDAVEKKNCEEHKRWIFANPDQFKLCYDDGLRRCMDMTITSYY